MNFFNLNHLPEPVARVLRSFYRLKRLYALLGIVFTTASLYLALALVAMHLDRVLFLTSDVRLGLSWGVLGVAVLYAVVTLLLFLFRAPSVRQIAYELGSRVPAGDDERYVTLDSVMRGEAAAPDSVRAELLGHLRHATEEHSREVRTFRLVRDPQLPRRAAGVLAILAVYAGLALLPGYQFTLMTQRFLDPGANLPKPSFVQIRVTPQKLVLGRGDEAVIQAETEGEIPALVAWLYRLAGAVPNRCVMASVLGHSREVAVNLATARELNRVQRRLFVFSQAELESSFSYRLRCGDAETAVEFVEVVAQPRITELRILAKSPAYTRRPPADILNPRQAVQLFPGTQVELVFTVDQAVTERKLLLGTREGPAPKWDAATRTGRYAFTMQDKVELEVKVRNARGFANVERARVSLVRLDDRPPTLQLEYPGADLTVVPGELIPVQALAEDDLEVAKASFRYQLNPETNPDAPFQEFPLPLTEPHGTRVSLTENFDLGQTTAGPGDELLFAVRVRDSAGNDGESRPVRLRVTAFTRGENERRRLAALTTVGELLDALATPPAAAAPALDKTLYDTVQKKAVGRGIALDPAPAFASLFRLLEAEQHFTDAPRHKEDLREFTGVLSAAWAQGELPGTAAAAWPQNLSSDVLGPLVRSRRLQNVVWRLFGMQYEIADIRQRLTEADAVEARQGAERRQALTSFILGVAEDAAARQDVQAALKKELELRRQISEIKAKAKPVKATEGEQVDNPFAPLQVDVEVTRLKPEDEKRVAELGKQLTAATAERGKLAAAAVSQAVGNTAAMAAKSAALGLAPKELEMLTATVFDRVTRPATTGPKAGSVPAASPEARKTLAAELATERLKDRAGAGESSGRKSTARRTELYLKALEDIGVDLAAVAAGCPVMDAATLKALQGELNTAGYYLNRGGQAKNLASCDEVTQLLGRLLEAVRPALPVLLREEQQARERLHLLYQVAWNRVAAGLPLPATSARRPELALAWAENDLRLLERNPFAPLTPRLRDLALLDALEATDAPPAATAALTAFLAPDGTQAAATAEELRVHQLLALDWELGELLAAGRIAAPEKALAARLLEFTAVLAGDTRTADPATLEKTILALPLAPVAGTPPAEAPAAFAQQALAGLDLAVVEAVLLKAAQERLALGRLRTVAGTALERAAAAAKAVDALELALNSGDTALPEALGNATATIGRTVRSYEQLVRLAALDVGYVDPLAAGARQEERLFLRLREAVGRYRGRAGLAVQNLEAARTRELDAAQLGSIGADLSIIKAGVQALHNALKTGLDDYAAADAGPKYPILEAFAETRAWVGTARDLLAAKRPADVAEQFVKQFAAARLEFLAARCSLLDTGIRELHTTETALDDAANRDPARVTAHLTAATQAYNGFLSALEKAGKGPFQDRCRQETAALLARVTKLAQAPAAPDPTEQRRRLLELSEVVKDTQRLLRRVRAELDSLSGPQLEYAGGPDRIWLQETRMDAEIARQRLLGQLRHARRRFTLGILDALETPPTPAACRELQAWGLVCHRVPRSPLSGVVTPPRAEAGGDSARNPLVKWLLEQLEEAAGETRAEDSLRNYPGISRELIQASKDFMRY